MMAEFVRKPMEHTNGHCQNCGHPSHCGGSLQQEVRDYPVDIKDNNYNNTRMIEVASVVDVKTVLNSTERRRL